MIYQERGISPATEWQARLEEIQTVIKERNIKVVKELTHGFVIDSNGEYWIFRRGTKGQIIPHHFRSIGKALDQIERVIEEKAGFQETIGRHTLEVAGDNSDLVKIGSMLLESGRLLITLPPETKSKYATEIATDVLPKLTKARSLYKKEAAEILRQIIGSEGRGSRAAKELEKAGKNVFQAAIDGIGVISGENVRLISGLHWLGVWGRRSLDVYGLLVEHYKYLKRQNKAVEKKEPQTERKREYFGHGLIESLTRGQGIFWKIDHIEGNPFFKRFQSPEVRTFRTLPELVEGRDYDLIEKRLEAAVKKLRAIRRDWKRAEIRLTERPTRS